MADGARRGRGARTNASAASRRERREAFDDGWETPGRAEPFATHVRRETAAHHRHQRQPRHQLRPVDQPLSRLRAWLHLLLRAAHPRLSRPLARASTSRPALRQDQCAELLRARAAAPGYVPEHHRAWRHHRPLPADRARAPHHARRARGAGGAPATPSASSPNRRSWCATSTSSRAWPRAISSRSPSRSRRSTAASPAAWSRAPRRRRAGSRRSAAGRGRHTGQRHGRTDHSGAQRPRDRGDTRGCASRPARAKPAT